MPLTQSSIVINRPVHLVFKTILDLEGAVEWSSQLNSCKMLNAPPLAVGSKYEQVIIVFGRRVEYEYEIIELDEENFTFSSECKDDTLPVILSYKLTAETKDTTIIVISSDGEVGTIFKTIATPILTLLTRKSLDLYLNELKDHLEK